MARSILAGATQGKLIVTNEGLSFWGGVNPHTGDVYDTHHPLHGQSLANKILMLPTSRGSCSGSGVLLELALNGIAPAALIFREAESVLTLGALVAANLFDKTIPVLQVNQQEWEQLSAWDGEHVQVSFEQLHLPDGAALPLSTTPSTTLQLSEQDQAMLTGEHGPAAQIAMRILCAMAQNAQADQLIDVSQGHIDGCIYASPANLVFANMFKELGAKVRIPTTMNAISVEMAHWREQQMDSAFGTGAAALAQAYVDMGAMPSFTCSPYLLEDRPKTGSNIGWSESNAVIFANSVLGAKTDKHPDFLDLCIALTGRAPYTGMYLPQSRTATKIIAVAHFDQVDDSFWPLLGYIVGQLSPDRIPLITGVDHLAPSEDDLKGLCAAFGTTSGAPMLHVAGITPECHLVATDAVTVPLTWEDLLQAWQHFNPSATAIDLVALGSPHFSLEECRTLAHLITQEGASTNQNLAQGIITLGQAVKQQATAEGLVAIIEAAGFRFHTDLCWCSISEPVFPTSAATVLTNSGKYAHYGPGLSGRKVHFAGLASCLASLRCGEFSATPPNWLAV
ncbi:DUF521 domain-containing protein [Maribrevibacterium harenarium]|uniref:DUF521 domain-containing protein n=1 Tax=Maribrevibacterium harenarium TaxID=2589817 RepID=A0A501X195_9GAMM|nr:aconitase X [Maribrevibacterium harenarium]TPE53406.1 DUF521 domain-containing protein [Maribrevibacterium harenarium]